MKTSDGHSPPRRRFLIGGIAAAFAIAATTFSWNRYGTGRALWIEDVVRRNLPAIRLDEPSLAVFINDVLAGDLLTQRKRRIWLFAHQTMPWLTTRMPEIHETMERLERLVLSDYLIGSNFFRVPDPRQETITYYGRPPACGNPFFSLPRS